MPQDEYVYVVTRDGRRVSHKNHNSREEALRESAYWTKVIHTVLSTGKKVDPKSVIRVVRTDRPNKIK